MSNAFRDPDFKLKLIAFICRDRTFLKEHFHLLDPDDFKPRKQEGPERWIIASTALDYYRRYRDKIGDMLRSEMLDFSRKQKHSESQRKTLLQEVKKINELDLSGIEHMSNKVMEFKQEEMKVACLDKLNELYEAGELTNEALMSTCQKAIDVAANNTIESVDYFSDEEFQNRQVRRGKQQARKFPLIFIDPVDENIRLISRGHLGLVMAPYKKGKSLFMAHIALHYTLQGLKGLYFTLEDPRADVEDRLDAMISRLPIKRLNDMPVKLRNRFRLFKRLVRGGLKIVDGTGGKVSIAKIQEIFEQYRNQGFTADFVMVDYDDFIVPSLRRKERRQEFHDIYLEYGNFLRNYHLIGWVAAQTVRKTEHKKVIGGDTVAEDISKIRKASCALGIGQGDWGEKSLYIYVAAHKYDKMHIGWNIMSDKDRMIFYDRDATREQLNKEINAVKEDAGEDVIDI